MSVSLEFYFNWQGTVAEMAVSLRRLVGVDFNTSIGREDIYTAIWAGLEVSLQGNDQLDAPPELDFESFRYVLTFYTSAGRSVYRPVQLELSIILIYLLWAEFQVTGILAFDAQRLLARYQESGGKIVDLVSKKPVEFPQHFADVSSRLPYRF
jgi:hypothetical protein